ncbi:DUF5011 domain-containing protein [Saccharibacillus sp. CPCC 101409]|uniref:RCC1 domain-containing protein n=1 Tax=Saccharibacillus sp. CPCC 101409 TaxID=3058041 RepID=UPI00267263B3|nr:immunoglobulin-like domain-containing protein [Saccharibacillus sp. CPCC 101409]MDO3411278.1 DUF5011 domain-containing protein [Saccharibacillus sp. CPCC 101409]
MRLKKVTRTSATAIKVMLVLALVLLSWPFAGGRIGGETRVQAQTTQASEGNTAVYGFGSNTYGQLGLGDTRHRVLPTELTSSGSIKQVAGSLGYALILTESGKVYASGSNESGQLGLSDTLNRLTPIEIPNLSGVKQVAAGYNFSLALTESGNVYAFGDNTYGQLGLSDIVNRSMPTEIPNLSGVKQVAAGMYHTLALTESGKVYAFGGNNAGQLGLGNTGYRLTPTEIPNLSGVKQIAAGGVYTLALMENGKVYAFGMNSSGELGVGAIGYQLTPTEIPNLSGVKQIAAGEYHTLALMENGKVYAFGYNYYGQLGLSDNVNRLTPTEIPNLSEVKQIAAGAYHTLALMENGEVYAFGNNGSGQLGLGHTYSQYRPIKIPNMRSVQQVAAGLHTSFLIAPKQAVVRFDSQGGTPVIDAKADPVTDLVAKPAVDPTREGYRFDGWYTDADGVHVFDFSTRVTVNTTLYAKWSENRSPLVELTTNAGNPTNRPFDVIATFDEDVTGFDASKIEVTGGTVGAVGTVSERVYEFEVTPTEQGSVTVNLLTGAARDAAGNPSEASNTLSLNYNTTAPTLTLNGSARMAVALDTPFVDPLATARDAQGEDLIEFIGVTGDVYTDKAGTYELTYSVSDSAANTSTVTRSVYVIEPPVVKLNGEAAITLEEGASFVDPGATASDAFHGDLSDTVVTEGGVDTGKPGVYTLNYTVTNPIGQTGNAQRQVTVTKKAEPPVVEPPVVQPPAKNPPSSATPSVPVPSLPGPIASTDGNLTLAAGQAGQVSLGSDARLQIPAGATNQQMQVRMNVLTAANNGLPAEAKPLSAVYQLTKTAPANFLLPVGLTLSFDPSKLEEGEQAVVFYRNEDGSPWVRMDGGAIEQGRNAVGSAAPSVAAITVQTDHFTKFAVLAVSDTAAAPNPNDTDDTGNTPAIAFTDITGHWAAGAIREAASLGLVNGYADGTFRPSGAVTRAEFTTMLVRAFSPIANDEAANGGAKTPLAAAPFADQSSIRDWAGASIAQARLLDWVQGDRGGNFRPNDAVTRAEMAAMLYRALTLKGADESALNRFNDANAIPAWAREAAAALTATGILQGGSGGAFAPNAAATRAETVQVLMRAYQ